jgi:hypothetical protein
MTRASRWLGAAVFGLPVAVTAHFAMYGNGHVMAGSYHDRFIDAALLGGSLGVILLGLVALLSSKRIQTGSILAARLQSFVPAWLALTLCAAGWFAAIEGIEPQSGALSKIAILAIAAVAACARLALTATVRAFAAIAVAFFTPVRAQRARFFRRNRQAPLALAFAHCGGRLFARPPPAIP